MQLDKRPAGEVGAPRGEDKRIRRLIFWVLFWPAGEVRGLGEGTGGSDIDILGVVCFGITNLTVRPVN